MNLYYCFVYLLNCDIISHVLFIDCSISGLVFTELDEPGLKEYGFVRSGFYALRGVLKEVFDRAIVRGVDV